MGKTYGRGQVYNVADASLNTAHISSNYQNYEAARSSFFVLTIPDDQLANLLRVDYTGNPFEAGAGDVLDASGTKTAEALRLNVVRCPIPSFDVQTGEYRRGNDVVKFATTPTFKGDTIVVDDIVGLDTKSILQSWLYLAYNPNTRMGGRMADYKKTAILTEYTQDYAPIRNWNIEGIFVTGIDEGDFDRENDSKRQLTVKFAYDRATVDFDFA